MLKYMGLSGTMKYNTEMKVFVGELKNTDYLVTYTGKSVNDLTNNFRKAVDSYQDSKNKKKSQVYLEGYTKTWLIYVQNQQRTIRNYLNSYVRQIETTYYVLFLIKKGYSLKDTHMLCYSIEMIFNSQKVSLSL